MTSARSTLAAVLILILLVVIAGTLLIHRGFRANSTPSAWEASVARRIRNYAIPSNERGMPNPVALTADSLQQGRNQFLARCATCHGVDGSGRTPIGANTYPKVPDLRSPATQDLTDGQLHYIIENGV